MDKVLKNVNLFYYVHGTAGIGKMADGVIGIQYKKSGWIHIRLSFFLVSGHYESLFFRKINSHKTEASRSVL
jgi:hypothetical protein